MRQKNLISVLILALIISTAGGGLVPVVQAMTVSSGTTVTARLFLCLRPPVPLWLNRWK
jgi:hypothetical protein